MNQEMDLNLQSPFFFKYFQIEHIKKVLEFLWKNISPCKAVKIVWYSITILEAMACVITLS